MTLSAVPWRLVLAGLVVEAGCLALRFPGAVSPGDRVSIPLFLGIVGVMAAAWAAAARTASAGRRGSRDLAVVLGFALLFWVTLLPGGPFLDDDIHRYLWEGKVVLAGESPYLHAPADPALASLRDDGWRSVGYPGIPSPYGPAAQYLFAAMRLAGGGGVVAAKAVVGTFFALTVWLSLVLLDLAGADRRLVILWAWHPAVLKEFADSGHLEPFVIAAMLGAALLLLKGREGAAGAALAAGACAKFFPLLLLPAFLARSRRRAAFLGAFAATALLFYLPFLAAGERVLGSLPTYLGWWTFNHGPFELLRGAVGLAVREPDAAARVLFWLGAGVAAVLVGLGARHDRPEGFARRLGLLLFGVTVCSPAVMPWYLLWGLPFLLPRPVWSAFGFALAGQASYLYYLAGRDVPAARWAPYVLLAAGLAWEWRRVPDAPSPPRSGERGG